jgi:hypothetical protein
MTELVGPNYPQPHPFLKPRSLRAIIRAQALAAPLQP